MSAKVTHAIWQQIFFFIAIPFLVVLGFLLLSILHSAYESKISLANHLLVNKTRFSMEHLKFTLNGVYLTVEAGVAQLSRVDTSRQDARKEADNIIRKMLRNRNIYNVWLVYAPDAFDGRDFMERGNYPGAPSGRFIRSYIREGEQILLASNIDEHTLDSSYESPWCAGAMNSRKPHVSIDGAMLYDFQNGQGLQNLYAITVPLFREGIPIACVGAAGKITDLFSGLDRKTRVFSLLLTETLHLTGASDIENIGKSLDEIVDWSDSPLIQQALRDNKPAFSRNARFDLVGGRAMVYFEPVRLEQFGKLFWIATALPLSSIYTSMYLVIAVTIGAMLFFTLLLLFSLRYVVQKISSPIHAMSRIADDFDPEGAEPQMSSPHEKSFGQIAVSFQQMLSVLRKRIAEVGWQQGILDLHLFLERSLSPEADLPGFFRQAAPRFIAVYQAKGATLRLYDADAKEDTVIHYDPVSGFGGDNEDLNRWQTALSARLQESSRTDIVWNYDATGEPTMVCAFPLCRADEALIGAIFLCFDAPLSDELEYHAARMAEEIAHRLAGQEMELEADHGTGVRKP